MSGTVIVVGNEKGGTGKSTVAMHLATYLLKRGLRVGTIDLDARQATLTRYVENRARHAAVAEGNLPMPDHVAIPPTADEAGDRDRFLEAVGTLRERTRVVVVDTPGSAHPLSRLGHSHADLLITPLNDSLIDLDVLARVDPVSMRVVRPSLYSEMVWDGRKERAARGEMSSFEWIVMRNRLSNLDAHNKREMGRLLGELSRRIGFRLIDGLSERVIYRELFLKGLTLSDIRDEGLMTSMSHVAARQELRMLIEAAGLHRLVEESSAA